MTLLLGIDIGTSSVKALIFDYDRGKAIGLSSVEYPLMSPKPGYAEQEPLHWWEATIKAVQHVMSDVDSSRIAAIGMSGQMHGTVLLDSSGHILAPAIIWADQRGTPYCKQILDQIGEVQYTLTTGTAPASGFQATTLMWLSEHDPELLQQVDQVILPKDYVRYRMTGTVQTDISDAASTGLFNILKKAWAEEIIEGLSLPKDIFPQVAESYAVSGELQDYAAKEMGLPAGIPVVVGCADQAAQAIGNGLIEQGSGSITIGSGGQVFIPQTDYQHSVEKQQGNVHIFNHASSGTYVLGATLAAGLSLSWLRDVFQLTEYENAYALLASGAASVRPGAEGLIFLPYLNGERTPHMDACARGAFIGLSGQHRRSHMARAVMEGVGFSLREALESCEEISGPVDRIILSGGGSASAVWEQMLADILQRTVQKSLHREQTALGAAWLAGIGIGLFGDTPEAGFSTVKERFVRYDEATEPQERTSAFYAERFGMYRQLYKALRGHMHELAGCT